MNNLASTLAPIAIEQATKFIAKKANPPSSELATAAAVNDKKAVKALLADHPNVNRTPALVAASAAGLLDTLDILLNTSASRSSHHSGTTEEFRKKYLNAWSGGTTPLLAAVKENHSKTAKLLLAEGADPNLCTRGSQTPLGVAARNGFGHVTRTLLKAGASVDYKDTIGDTALIIASRYGHSHTARYLLEQGAKIDAKNVKGGTPLLVAARHDNPEVVDLLLKSGADVHARDKKGKGVLHRVVEGAWFGDRVPASLKEELINTFLEAGADPRVKDVEGKTAAQRVGWVRGSERLKRLLDPSHQSQKHRLEEEERDEDPYKRRSTF